MTRFVEFTLEHLAELRRVKLGQASKGEGKKRTSTLVQQQLARVFAFIKWDGGASGDGEGRWRAVRSPRWVMRPGGEAMLAVIDNPLARGGPP